MRGDGVAKILILEHAGDGKERGTVAGWMVEERADGIFENPIHAIAPAIRPAIAEGADNLLGNEVALVGCRGLEEVEAKAILGVAWIEVHHVTHSFGRNVLQELEGGLAVEVEKGKAMSVLDVIDCETFHQRGFAGAGLADDVEVIEAILFRNAKRHLSVIGDMSRTKMYEV